MRSKFECMDCKCQPYAYMVRDSVWEEALPKLRLFFRRRINLCLPCLSSRLGRKLVLSDFTDVPINDTVKFCVRGGVVDDTKAE